MSWNARWGLTSKDLWYFCQCLHCTGSIQPAKEITESGHEAGLEVNGEQQLPVAPSTRMRWKAKLKNKRREFFLYTTLGILKLLNARKSLKDLKKEKNQMCLEEEVHWWPINTKEPSLSQEVQSCQVGDVWALFHLSSCSFSASIADHYLKKYTWLNGVLQWPC